MTQQTADPMDLAGMERPALEQYARNLQRDVTAYRSLAAELGDALALLASAAGEAARTAQAASRDQSNLEDDE